MGLFSRTGNAEHREQRTVSLDGASSVNARIEMSVGELVLTGGATELMEADFLFDRELEPNVDYTVRRGVGELSVRQSKGRRSIKPHRNRWKIALNDDVPIDIHLRLATGTLDARLSSLRLTNVRVNHTTGESFVDVGGHQLELAEVVLDQATGSSKLHIDGNYAALTRLQVVTTAGETEIDMAGSAWGQNLDARIDVTTGSIVVLLPRDTGVEVHGRTTLGQISAEGLRQDGRYYYNEAFGSSPATLRFDVRASIGKVALKVVD